MAIITTHLLGPLGTDNNSANYKHCENKLLLGKLLLGSFSALGTIFRSRLLTVLNALRI